jgi:hypothetical protein
MDEETQKKILFERNYGNFTDRLNYGYGGTMKIGLYLGIFLSLLILVMVLISQQWVGVIFLAFPGFILGIVLISAFILQVKIYLDDEKVKFNVTYPRIPFPILQEVTYDKIKSFQVRKKNVLYIHVKGLYIDGCVRGLDDSEIEEIREIFLSKRIEEK